MCNSWIVKRRIELLAFFGNRCNNPECQSTEKLEFAHITPIFMDEGRGRNKRILAINKNITDYILLCKDCHTDYDAPTHKRTNEEKQLDKKIWVEKMRKELDKDIRGDLKVYYNRS